MSCRFLGFKCFAYTAGVEPPPYNHPPQVDFIAKRFHLQSGFHSTDTSPAVCFAYTAGVNPRPTGANAYRVRSLRGGRDPDALRRPAGSAPPSASLRATSNCLLAQDDIPLTLRVQMRTKCEAHTAGVEPPPYGCKCAHNAKSLTPARALIPKLARS